jgi:hypothetical protein
MYLCVLHDSQAIFQVLMVMRMKMAVFWDVSPCSLVDINPNFRGAYYLHYHSDEMSASNEHGHTFTSIQYHLLQVNMKICFAFVEDN